jgi:hypothetical protein
MGDTFLCARKMSAVRSRHRLPRHAKGRSIPSLAQPWIVLRQGRTAIYWSPMLQSTAEEKQTIIDYMNWQAPDLTVEFLQKVYAENVLDHQHVVWDVHTNVDRWWVITNPTNLYAQDQFPNMDLAVTFHVGLCLRVPRSQRAKLSELSVEPLAACFRHISEASDALEGAQEVSDFQTIGVRCREALLAFTSAAQVVMLDREMTQANQSKLTSRHGSITCVPPALREDPRTSPPFAQDAAR